MSPVSIFKASGLDVGFSDRTLFSGLSLSIDAGDFISLMGRNGSGKSTLLRTIAGLQDPKGGREQGVNHSCAVVLTDRIGNPFLRVREVVEMGRYPFSSWLGRLSASDLEIAGSAMDSTRISFLADVRIGKLSDGQQQLVMLARAFAQQPRLMVLDEPTSHLDPAHRREVMELLKDWVEAADDRAVVFSTHEIDLTLRYATKLWMADRGHLHTGVPEEMIQQGLMEKVFGTGRG